MNSDTFLLIVTVIFGFLVGAWAVGILTLLRRIITLLGRILEALR